jgi:hypothetical protein
MDRNFDIFRMGANGVDPDRGTSRFDQRDARTAHAADPPFEHGLHHHPDDPGWSSHAQHLESTADYGYGDRDRDRYAPPPRRDYREVATYPYPAYGNVYPGERHHAPEVWRGRNEVYDFWGRERHPYDEHPSMWQRVKGVFTGKGPKNYTRSDERIHEDVCEHLSAHPYVDASDIEVIVRDGEVTLSGTVDARIVKRAAEDSVEHVAGVKDVHNHLRVRPERQSAP